MHNVMESVNSQIHFAEFEPQILRRSQEIEIVNLGPWNLCLTKYAFVINRLDSESNFVVRVGVGSIPMITQ